MEAKSLATTCYLTVDETFPQFPGAEMWNPPNVRGFSQYGELLNQKK